MSDAPVTLPKSLIDTLPGSSDVAIAINELSTMIETLATRLQKARERGAIPLARAFVVMHRLKDKLDSLDKQFSTLYEPYKTTIIPEMFEAENITSLPLSEGFRVGVSQNFRASIRKDCKEDAYKWLRENGLGDLITDTVNASSLSAAAKYELEENGIEFPEAMFNVAIVPNTSVTVTKK